MFLLVLTLNLRQAWFSLVVQHESVHLVVATYQNPAPLHRVILEPILFFSSYSNEMLGMDYGSYHLPHKSSQQFKFHLKRKLLKCED